MDKRLAPTLLVTTTLAALAGAMPQSASAVTICAGDASADCFLTYPGTSAGLNSALSGAETGPGADVVRIGPGTYSGEFSYLASDPVEIVGSGATSTRITSPDAKTALRISSPSASPSTVSDLEVAAGPGTGAGVATALALEGAAARRVRVTNPLDSDTQVAYGVTLGSGGEFHDGVVDMGRGKGIVTSAGGEREVTDSLIRAATGVEVHDGTATLARLRIEATRTGVAGANATTKLRNSLVLLTGTPQGDKALEQYAGGTLSADGVTLIGGPAAEYGAAAGQVNSGTATLNMKNSIVYGFAKSFTRYALAPHTADLNVSYSRFVPPGAAEVGPAQGGGAYSAGPGNLYADPAFVNPAFGDPAADYHLRPDSPVIDVGEPGPVLDKDLDGGIRSSDGDGSSGARQDMGAYEYRPAPAAPASVPEPATPPAASPAVPTPPAARDALAPALSRVVFARKRLRFVLSEPAAVTVVVQRRRGRKGYRRVGVRRIRGRRGVNRVAFKRVGAKALTSGRYRLQLIATDRAANTSRARRLSFVIPR